MLDFLPQRELEVLKVLRSTCQNCLIDAREKLSYNVPFYYRNRRIAFIWPGSIPWGQVTFEGVQFGICNAYLIPDSLEYLEHQGRKQVYTRKFHTVQDIDVERLNQLLFAAYAIDDEFRK
jgi:hypothetical protein